MTETIIAPASPGGRGGVAVIRISGKEASHIGKKLCSSLPKPWSLKPCFVVNNQKEIIDQGLVVFFRAPKSYTGEDVVEIHCHGNPLIVDSVVSSGVFFGARLAEPGEFTKRAFLNNKIDLAQAESVADLIASETSQALKGASSSLMGGFSSSINSLVDGLVECRVFVEAVLDFPEEGVDKLGYSGVDGVLGILEKDLSVLEGLIKGSGIGLRLREGAGVVLIGPPNCGKSTLLNYLSGGDVAIVSEEPGTTRDLVKASVNLSGLPVELVDTAGFRSGVTSSVEREGIERAKKEVSRADFVLVMSVVGEEFSFVPDNDVPYVRVFNKSDLFEKKDLTSVEGVFFISAKTGDGVGALVQEVHKGVGFDLSIEVPVLARRRHLEALKGARGFYLNSINAIKLKRGLELAAEEMRGAQRVLGEITRPVSSDDLLDKIFSEFCIGK